MLSIRFSTVVGRAEVRCDEQYVRSLQTLRGRLPSAQSVNALTFDVDIEELLVNLNELAQWPQEDHANVTWQPELLTLVEQNASDAAVMATRLDGADTTSPSGHPALQGGWKGSLNSLQIRNLSKLISLSHGADFSVPGAGKTRVALATFQARRDRGTVKKMLVVCPKSAFESWQNEIRECYQAENVPYLAVMNSAQPPVADIVIINYERLPAAKSALIEWLRRQPTLLVLDEAHRTKLGAAGAWGAACLTLGPYSSGRLILTGTPAPNGSQDLENLMSFVWPGQGRLAVSRAVAGNDLRNASRLLRPLFVRTTKAELELPPVHSTVERVDLTPLHREIYNSLIGQMSARVMSGAQDLEALGKVMLYLLMAATTPALLAVGSSRYEPLPYRLPPLEPSAGSSLADLMRDLPDYELAPKYVRALKIISDNAHNGRKTLVWSTFVRSLTSLSHLLSAYNPALIHGGTTDRDEQLKKFRSDDSCMVLLSNPATLGEGVSLHQVCHEMIYIDRDFAAGRFLQSVDRIHRLGLDPGTVTRVRVLVANETIDEMVERRLKVKLDFMGKVLDDPEVVQLGDLEEEPTISGGMDNADIRELIEYLGRATS
ncbi:DEAD/DEAH box helicase [Actinoplanes sp. NPDC004185]